MSRILIEFYSQRAPENLISMLQDRFDKILFLYFQSEKAPTPQIQNQLTGVVQDLFGFEPEFVSVSSPKITCVLDTLKSVVQKGNTYVIDITGGNEIFIASAGIFYKTATECTVQLRHYDVKSGVKTDDYPTSAPTHPSLFPKSLKATHLLALNGTPPLSAPKYSFSYGLLRGEILRLWRAVRSNLKDWNRFCSLAAEDSTPQEAPFRKTFLQKEKDQKCFRSITNKLKTAGILRNERELRTENNQAVTFDLNVPREALLLYEKAGNLLELYTAMAAYDSGLFSDIRVGVTLDWNGIFAPTPAPDPRNEIDLVLVRENLPVLASCKNTFPKNDFLYEISTMASHYGGYYATAMLLSSYRATPAVRQRAKEMGIILMDDIRTLPYEKLVSEFKNTFDKK